ncbi:hypothetical protein SEVIR_2G302600v4 [Setaria viridis]|uniref:Phytocyanin domain-containing protein n=2 Tax=Setaria TaxID=4554 RepID=A0A368Q645_SETIT|nr:mavicyanin-like [Setaria italica]XP_034578779.1 mavicyanin-like [Setaria viridis]RCV12720.1 hypothetical protein SETIT_2G291600v2 [Setaria italica]TKW34369.1 hypothetical protein SEVIR_2G302600v2 [Setaria viridis]
MGGTSLSSTGAAATLLLVLLAAALRHGTGATEYTVGDSAGWTIGPNYLTWSQKYNFTAGDTLVFNYVAAQHNVYRVTQDAFRTCEPPAANQTMGSWETGRDRVDLPVPGDYYFICNVAGHCLGGMKFAVAVAAPPPPPPPSPPPPALPLPPPPASSAGVSWIARRRPAWPELVQRRIPCLAVIGLLVLA